MNNGTTPFHGPLAYSCDVRLAGAVTTVTTNDGEQPADEPAPVGPDEASPPAGRPRRRRWPRVAGVVVVVLALVGATLRLFVYPTVNAPTRADAIVMLDGIGNRKAATFALARAGYAPVVAISTQSPGFCAANLPTIPGVRFFCFVPKPATTQGEAEQTAQLAAQYGWKKVIVVVGRPQATRARIRIDRCFDGQLIVTTVAPPRSAWPYTIAYEWGALVKAEILQRPC